MERNKQAINWITSRLEHVAKSYGAQIISIDWKKQENERLFMVEIRGRGGKKVAKLFEPSELAQCPLIGEDQMKFDSRLSSLIRFFKIK
jgi:hypothetical protein